MIQWTLGVADFVLKMLSLLDVGIIRSFVLIDRFLSAAEFSTFLVEANRFWQTMECNRKKVLDREAGRIIMVAYI